MTLAPEVADLAVRWVPAACTVGITASRDGRITLSEGANPLGRWLNHLEAEFAQGPTCDVRNRGETVVVADTATEPRWGQLPGEMRDAGVRSLLAVPVELPPDGRGTRAALALYSDLPRAFEDGRGRGDLPALLAAVRDAITATPTEPDRVASVVDLQTALVGRSVVGQAVGLVMGRRGCTAREARAHLRRLAALEGIPLVRVAQDLVDSLGPPTAQP
ncbi:GAF and ANTAR domain-containing protein [Nakamurella flavida]|uniref:GAF and ANTAR domain-containing protein n=1 Tax=Nakamurella flavida TaxID=363630 RepID=A0A939C2F6_9ACTN|nr:GAF and ANTAR domain-containing protein [Nakamurella flavida]MBM9476520.1 GAF and ANTAR domain-containing protein [Nakamurella flavida]MDP9779042.1 hypothetical protein [Nakamurella flavida]